MTDPVTGIEITWPAAVPTLAEAVRAVRHAWARRVLEIAGGNIMLAARIAGIDRSNMRRHARAAGVPPRSQSRTERKGERG